MREIQKYRMTFKCACGNVFKKITTNKDLESAPCPECRKAKLKSKRITKFTRLGDGPIPESEVAEKKLPVYPNTIYKCSACFALTKIHQEVGDNNLTECPACDSREIKYVGHIDRSIPEVSKIQNKAVDVTANIVMEDYKMGDIKDDVRPGETMAKNLEPRLQKSADNFFSGNKKKSNAMPQNAAKLAKTAMAGGFRDRSYRDPVAAIQPSFKPNVQYVNKPESFR